MIPVSNTFNAIINGNSERQFNYTILKNGTAVDLDDLFQIQITEQGASEARLGVGEFCRNQLQIIARSTLAVQQTDVFEISISVEGASDVVPLGKFWVYEVENAASNYEISILAYSVPEAINSEVTFSSTHASDNAAEIQRRLGMTITNVSILDAVYTLDPTGTTIFDYLAACAGIAGYNIKTTRDGNLTFYRYPNVQTAEAYEISEDRIFNDGMSVKGNQTVIESVSVTGPTGSTETIGTGYGIEFKNNLIVNPLTVASTIYSVYANYAYTRMSVHYTGNPALEIGDVVSITDNTGTYYGVVMEQTFLLDGGLSAQIESYSDQTGRNIIPYSSIRANLNQLADKAVVSTTYYYLENTGTKPSKTDSHWSTTQTWTDGLHKWRMAEVTYGSGYYERLEPEDITGNSGRGVTSKTDYYLLTCEYDTANPKHTVETTKTGTSFTTTDAYEGNAESVIITVPIRQEGTGTTSASNIRPFILVNSIAISTTKDGDTNTRNYYLVENIPQGTIDLTDGRAYSEWRYIEQYDGETAIPGEWKSDRDVYAAGTLPSMDAEVLYKLSERDVYEIPASNLRMVEGAATYECALSMEVTYAERVASTWVTSPVPDTDIQNRYLWWKYTEAYTDNTSYTSEPALINMFTESETFRYWKTVAEGSGAPEKPTSITVLPPAGWTELKPSVSALEHLDLYYVDLTVNYDGTFEYTTPQFDSDNEDKKRAYYTALAATEQANMLKNIFADSTSAQAFADLTSGGALQGLFISANNMAYLNADFIKASSISADKLAVSDLYALNATLGGFQIDSDSIHTVNVPVTSNAENSVALSSNPYGFQRTIGTTARTGLKLAIGDNFAVDKTGTLYANNGQFTGTVSGSVIEFGTGDFRLIASYGEWEDAYGVSVEQITGGEVGQTEPTTENPGGSSTSTLTSRTVGGVLFQGAGSAKFAVGTVFELAVKETLADTTSNDLNVLYASNEVSIFSDPNENGYDIRFGVFSSTSTREFYIEKKQTIALCSKPDMLWSAFPMTFSGGSAILGTEETTSSYGFEAVSLRMNTGQHEDPVLVAYGGNQYGVGVLLEGQGTTIVAGGEAGKNLVLNNVNSTQAGSDESVHIAADSSVYIYSNCQTIANRKQMTFDTDGNLTVPGRVKQSDPVALSSWGTYSTANTTVTLREDYTNYRFLILRFGSDPSSGQIGGISLMTIPTSMIGSAAIFQHGWYQGTAWQSMTFSFPTATTLKIVTRSGSVSGLRQVFGTD